MNQWIRASIFCDAVPLATGIGVFLLWWILRWEIFMFAGILTVLVGIAVFVIGLDCLATYVWDVSRSKRMIDHRTLLKSLAADGLLAINLPVAVAIIVTVEAITIRCVVTVINTSQVKVDSFRVSGGGVDVYYGMIPAGATKRRGFNIQHEGELVYTGKHGTKPLEGMVDDYVANDFGETRRSSSNRAETLMS